MINRLMKIIAIKCSSCKLLLRDPAHFHRNDTTRRRVGTHFWRRRQPRSKRQGFNI